MTDMIERDALASDWQPATTQTSTDHAHEIKALIATPRMDQSILDKMRHWFKTELKPGIHITQKDADALRRMIIITSNSYKDREDETITTAALKAYEDACFPTDDGQFVGDNPLLWWHDDDVMMGTIETVNLSGPFLVEVFKESPTRVARVLWDFAEENGDNAGASHRFGYLEKDRDPDGTFHRIYKQETTYLPERDLAANERTYAGVMSMASAQSDKRLDEIFEKVAGIKNASAKLHAKSGELEKELEAAGIQHKAQKPPFPPKADTSAMPNPGAVAEAEVDEEVEEDAKDTPTPAALMPEVALGAFNAFLNLVQEVVDAQAGMQSDINGLKEYRDESKEKRVSEKAQDSQTFAALEARIKELTNDVAVLKAQQAMTPRSVTQQKGETNPEAAKAAIDEAVKSAKEQDLVDTPFGKAKKTV